mgnify:CR=1 FL=1
MKLTDIQYDMVAAYVKEELDGKRLADFEVTLKENKVLREEVMFQKSIGSALRLDMVEDAVKQAKIDNLLEDKTEHPKFEFVRNTTQQARTDIVNRQRQIRRWLVRGLVAACVVLVIGPAYNWYIDNQLKREINKEFAIIDIDPLENRPVGARTHVIEDYLEKIDIALQESNSDKIIEIKNEMFSLRINDDITMSQVQFALAIIDVRQDKHTEAIEKLNFILSKDNDITEKVQWLLGLAYLKDKQKKNAKEQFEALAKGTGKYSTKANEILKKHF